MKMAIIWLISFCLVGLAAPDNARVYYEWKPDTKAFVPLTKPLPPDSRWAMSPTFATDPPDPKESFKYKGQAQQDRICLEMFNDKQGGYFVDLAAHKWLEGSNTYNLEYFNKWNGICIEANPMDLVGLLGNRRCALYVNPVGKMTGEMLKFDFRVDPKHKKSKKGGAFGGFVGPEFDNINHDNDTAVDLFTVSLSDILDHAKAPLTIDYLSLDIEGAEFFALKNFPFDRRKFYLITAERPTRQLHHLLVKNNYVFVAEITNGDFGECIYIHSTFEGLPAQMQKWHHADKPPQWMGQVRGYLLHPKWSGSIEEYVSQGRKIDQHHLHAVHPSSEPLP